MRTGVPTKGKISQFGIFRVSTGQNTSQLLGGGITPGLLTECGTDGVFDARL